MISRAKRRACFHGTCNLNCRIDRESCFRLATSYSAFEPLPAEFSPGGSEEHRSNVSLSLPAAPQSLCLAFRTRIGPTNDDGMYAPSGSKAIWTSEYRRSNGHRRFGRPMHPRAPQASCTHPPIPAPSGRNPQVGPRGAGACRGGPGSADLAYRRRPLSTRSASISPMSVGGSSCRHVWDMATGSPCAPVVIAAVGLTDHWAGTAAAVTVRETAATMRVSLIPQTFELQNDGRHTLTLLSSWLQQMRSHHLLGQTISARHARNSPRMFCSKRNTDGAGSCKR